MLMNLFRPKGRLQRFALTKRGITVVRKRRPGAVVTGETRTRTTVRSGPRTVVSVRIGSACRKPVNSTHPICTCAVMPRGTPAAKSCRRVGRATKYLPPNEHRYREACRRARDGGSPCAHLYKGGGRCRREQRCFDCGRSKIVSVPICHRGR